ncbi:hypothetical protein [Klebsiella aerogenes EA1509E]|nr:hypothetical protein [Klebsiella aerogenes EA1509E]
MTPERTTIQQLQSLINTAHARSSSTRQHDAGYCLALHINIASFIVGLTLLTCPYQE